MKTFDWSRPQRQPATGLAIVFLNTLWQVIKAVWPFLLLWLLGNKEGGINRYEVIGIIFLSFTIISAVLNFIFFQFYLEEEKLIIKKGWFKKETKVIPLNKIQTANIEQGPLHQLLGVVKLSIDTAGSQKAEASIDAIHLSMAEDLQKQLLAGKKDTSSDLDEVKEAALPLIRLRTRDLLKLSISANHVETFFILLSFGVGLYENLKDLDNNLFSGLQDWLPGYAIFPILALIIFVLVITVTVSTIRIFFGFYDLQVHRNSRGFQIKSGLTNIKNRIIALPKIQFISWDSNWVRRKLGLWMLEYHVAGGDQLKNRLKVQVPVTNKSFIPLLTEGYHHLPDTKGLSFLNMHPSFITRRILVLGIVPLMVLLPLAWWFWGAKALWLLIYLFIILIASWCQQKKFRLWALDELMVIRRGILGEKHIILKWHKMQSVKLSQSIYQRKHGLANVMIYTAAGQIPVQFIPLESAQQLRDFILYKTESSLQSWN
ncbi:MAG: PH domain-containing protein [Flavisolibacter sp.]